MRSRWLLWLSQLVDKRGRDGKIVDWLDAITADCPKKSVQNMSERCGARCPDLPRYCSYVQDHGSRASTHKAVSSLYQPWRFSS